MASGTATHQWLTMGDGTRLSATLYLPDGAGPDQPTPCLLEALPYRKDDLTSSYRPEYDELRDTYGYAVCRLDLRGTGSSAGDAVDEYPVQELSDLTEVIAWLAAAPWCTGAVGMFGTSYSGFNAIQLAAERPPALKAICAIYASDDRYTDDVHYMGGLLKWLDLIDYCHYMTPMNALPPTPELWGESWHEEWVRRIETFEPWLLTWMEHQRSDHYWAQGSLRPAYDRIHCPTMIVAGWADGYRNNTFRTIEALGRAGVPNRLLAGPWAHMSAASSLPGPRIDLVREMARWWDCHLRGIDNGTDTEPAATWFVRESTRPAADLDTFDGFWRSDDWPTQSAVPQHFSLSPRPPYAVVPDIGTAAWISCAGHLPYGQSLDQRADDDASMTWDLADVGSEGLEIAGHPVLRLRVVASEPVATLAVRLCDVFSDGTSALVTRGVLNLTRRDGFDTAEPLVPGQTYDVKVELEATAWRWLPGQRVRIAVAGADWPNTIAPPRPVTVEVLDGELTLPVLERASTYPAPEFGPGGSAPEGEAHGVTWRIEDDVLRRTTTAVIDHGGEYPTPYGGFREHYSGQVEVNRVTFDQRATARVSFDLDRPDGSLGVSSDLEVVADAHDITVRIDLEAHQQGKPIKQRTWTRVFPRDLA